MEDIWDRWARYQEIAELELVALDLDMLIQQANQLTEEAKRISDRYEIQKPNKEADK